MLYISVHILVGLVSGLFSVFATPAWGQDSAAIQRGTLVFQAAGGCSCHTDVKRSGPFMAGGRPIKTPFGTFYSTNITPAPRTGLGTWSEADFLQAMTQGSGPNASHYFPVFPYTAFTYMSVDDVRDLKAYLFSLPPVERDNTPHDLSFPFNWRWPLLFWKWLFFRPGPWQPQPAQSPEWNRGAYLSTALSHCAECHTPRNRFGALQQRLAYAGTVDGPEGELAPNITPDPETGIGNWSVADMVWYLQTGLKPDGDDTQGLMSEVIEHGYKHLPEQDLRAIAVYLRTLPPLRNKVVKPKQS
ncbi:MAG: cytochrome c [Candidatus Tectimicrobiota bacterium]